MDYKILESFSSIYATKVAQQTMDEESHKLLSMYVAFTRAMYLLHQENHWAAQHYGDHLLFQRLYEEVQDEIIDDAAERVVGLCGSLLFTNAAGEIAKGFSAKNDSLTALLESSLAIEKAFQKICKKTYEEIKDKDMMTLGLDDMIMAQSSVGETHIYLLQQELKGYSE
jgi:DNA-binding ferritin-like protein